MLVVLSAVDGGDVRGEAGIDDNVLFARVGGDGEAADDFEAVAVMELVGYLAEGVVQVGEGEGFLGDVA